MKSFILSSIAAAILSATVASCSSGINVRVVNMPTNFSKAMQGGKNVAIIFRKSKISLSDPTWEGILQAEMENAVRSFGYFNIIDLKTRAARIQEISRSQTGLTSEEIQIGKEMKLDAYLFLEVANRPRTKCKTSYKKKKIYPCGDSKKCKKEEVKFTVKDLQFTVYLKGELINIASGQSLAHNNTDPVSVKKEGQNITQCYSSQEAFPKAAKLSAVNLARRLSPLVTQLRAEIDDDPVGSPEAVEDEVEEHLETGVEWAKKNDLAEAKKSWRRALDLSQTQSVYANWNMGIALWAEGNLSEAEAYLERAKSLGGPKFMDSGKSHTMNKFRQEQKRLSIEKGSS